MVKFITFYTSFPRLVTFHMKSCDKSTCLVPGSALCEALVPLKDRKKYFIINLFSNFLNYLFSKEIHFPK
jgi:hypothetical protein